VFDGQNLSTGFDHQTGLMVKTFVLFGMSANSSVGMSANGSYVGSYGDPDDSNGDPGWIGFVILLIGGAHCETAH